MQDSQFRGLCCCCWLFALGLMICLYFRWLVGKSRSDGTQRKTPILILRQVNDFATASSLEKLNRKIINMIGRRANEMSPQSTGSHTT